MSLFPAYIPNTSSSAGNEDLPGKKILQLKSEKETSGEINVYNVFYVCL